MSCNEPQYGGSEFFTGGCCDGTTGGEDPDSTTGGSPYLDWITASKVDKQWTVRKVSAALSLGILVILIVLTIVYITLWAGGNNKDGVGSTITIIALVFAGLQVVSSVIDIGSMTAGLEAADVFARTLNKGAANPTEGLE